MMLVAGLEKLRVMERSGLPRYSHQKTQSCRGRGWGWGWMDGRYGIV